MQPQTKVKMRWQQHGLTIFNIAVNHYIVHADVGISEQFKKPFKII